MVEKEDPDQFIRRAEEHMQAGRYEEAVCIYRKLVDACPSENSFLLGLAWACHDGGRLSDAIECFEELLSREVKQAVFTGFAYDELVRIFKSQGLYERLIQVCEKAVEVQPDDAGYLGELADAYLKAGFIEKAVAVYERMIAVDPLEADFYCRLGSALIRAGDSAGGEEAYIKAAEMDESTADSVFNKLSHVYSGTGNDEKAEGAQRKALDLRPDKPIYYMDLADILVKRMKFAEARDCCRQAVCLKPEDAPLFHNRLGNSLFRLGFHEEAVGVFLQAIALEPHNPFYYLSLAECFKRSGRHDEAAACLMRAQDCRDDVKCGPFSSSPR
ncbi:MAG: tetratricopeptide repeat protein [Deltaproteobacteria bacterium]|nr:tetratricopeptide repeat protein [Deltaproteobacteria bacterium]